VRRMASAQESTSARRKSAGCCIGPGQPVTMAASRVSKVEERVLTGVAARRTAKRDCDAYPPRDVVSRLLVLLLQRYLEVATT
jgi:hypothetical protein